MRVVVHGQVSELGRSLIGDELRQPDFEVTFIEADSPDRWAALAAADALIVDHAPMTKSDLSCMPNLRLIQRLGRGPFDVSAEVAAAQALGIGYAHNRTGFAAAATAEHTVMMMLALLRGLPGTHEYVRTGEWRGDNRFDAATRQLSGATVGLIGMGRIARQVARLLGAFRTRTLYWSRHRLSPADEGDLGVSYLVLPELAARCDIVSLHVRADKTDAFRFGVAEFACMRPDAYFINTSRGSLVDESALATALRRRLLAGAALDVFDTEPLPADSALRELNGVILTPHIAGRTREVAEAYYRSACANLGRMQRGEALEDLISPDKRGT